MAPFSIRRANSGRSRFAHDDEASEVWAKEPGLARELQCPNRAHAFATRVAGLVRAGARRELGTIGFPDRHARHGECLGAVTHEPAS
jgi:hypothetical protein